MVLEKHCITQAVAWVCACEGKFRLEEEGSTRARRNEEGRNEGMKE
jgi:hypothetical protein